ncbi:MAG: bifunctional diaminohydroxyphosphoribosylaminopyrimidine deaminase/5-amino-6-(5-phosphoribosylamino)uracil reductase RibD [Planctomycetaceae bacterium]
MTFSSPEAVMRHALELAAHGLGAVEPNPPVGAVIVDDSLRLLGEGYHERFGGPHAEVNAFSMAGESTRGGQLFVTLEPCNHHGQTPPCCDAIIGAGIEHVIVATEDPASHDDMKGIQRLREAGIEVEVGLLGQEARALLAPFTKLMTQGRPFVHAKWAMTLDGRIATRTGDSKWISGEESRAHVHKLRGRMDAIIVGIGTVLADDPELTARPAGPRTPTRIVLDSAARLPVESKLACTARETPVLLFCGSLAKVESINSLRKTGVEVLQCPESSDQRPHWDWILDELGRRRMTNVMVEGGSEVLGSCLDAKAIDWAHVFIAPKLLGGRLSLSPISGSGRDRISDAFHLESPTFLKMGNDVFVEGAITPKIDETVIC